MSTEPAGEPLGKVLVADDNPQIVELIEAYLEALPIQVCHAGDGAATLAAVEREQPDLILLDIMMPKRSGYEVCRQLKADPRWRQIPIIMVTALNEVGDRDRAAECGAEEFIAKPVNKIELLELVQRYLARARGNVAGQAE
jgi:CheY-like chemotaxis protein